MNGYSGLDNGDLSKKKKGPAARQQEELCLVCGDRASGKSSSLSFRLFGRGRCFFRQPVNQLIISVRLTRDLAGIF